MNLQLVITVVVVVGMISNSTSDVISDNIVNRIKNRFHSVQGKCISSRGNEKPAYECSGIMIKSVDDSLKMEFAWDLKDSDKQKDAFSVAYLRSDQQFSKFPEGYDTGLIIYPHLKTPRGKNTYRVFCSFPMAGHSDGRAGHGCRKSNDDLTRMSSHCDKQNIKSFNEWKSHFKKTENISSRQCAFDMTTKAAAKYFNISLKASSHIQKQFPFTYNELRIHAWNVSEADKLPIEAFFYIIGSARGKRLAEKYQDEFFVESGGEEVPIVGIRLPSAKKSFKVKFHKRQSPTKNATVKSNLVDLDESLSICGPFQIDIRELTIMQIQKHYETGRLSSVELTRCYLRRISQIDIYLKSVIEVNPEAISLAERADVERSARLNDNPMHGIPILIKDNIGTADLMQTTAGAEALENLKPIYDADVVTRLRKAGAIILGKASLSEWAGFRDDDIPVGWSGRGGQTLSAYVYNENPSGSSSGSGVSISANLAAVSLGTETSGSIISPSTRNGLVGLKTTLGLVSTRGVIPLSPSSDVVGPMVRSVEDAAILMRVISDVNLQGCDVNVSSCLEDRNFRIGVVRDPFWSLQDSSLAALEDCLHIINSTGLANVDDSVRVPFVYDIEPEKASIIWTHEFKYSLNKYLRNRVRYSDTKRRRRIYTLADVIDFNLRNQPMERYKQNVLVMSEATDGLRNKIYLSAQRTYRKATIRYLNSIFDNNNVDALASPCYTDEDIPLLYSYGAGAGYPSITVPVGTDNTDVPFGLCLLGRPNSEAVLLKLGFFIEQSRPSKRPVPCFVGF